MSTRYRNILLSLTVLPLAACGGSDGNVSSTPAPPVGAINENVSNLVASQTFDTASTTLTATFTDPNDVPSNVVTNQSAGIGNAVTLAYNATNQSYTVNINQGGIVDAMTYRASDRDNDPAAGFIEYERDASNGDDTELTLRRAGSGGSNLSYVNYGLWEREVDQAGNADLERWAMFVYGLRTSATQLPTTGTASYNGTLDGLWTTATASYRLSGTTALTADFAGNTVSGTLSASGRNRETGSVVAMDTLSGTANISRSDASFAGSVSGSNGFVGNWNGAFFGPTANEAGGTFSATRGGETAVGVFVAGQ